MVWHLEYEFFSAVIVFIVIVYCFNSNFLPTLQNKVYRYILVCTFLFILINIAASLSLNYYQYVPLFISSMLNQLYLIFLPLIPAFLMFYIITIIYNDVYKKKNLILLLSIPFFICMFAAITNPFTNLMFSITKQYGYTRGNGFIITYSTFFFYVITGFILSIKYKNKIESTKLRAIRSFLFVTFVAIICQAIFMQYILTGAASSCAVLLMYLSMQNGNLFTDELTDTFNRNAFMQMIELDMNTEKQGTIITIALDDFKFANETFGAKICDMLLKSICDYLKTTSPDERIYRLGGDTFSIIINGKSEEYIYDFIVKISEKFKKSWTINDIDYILSASICIVDYPKNASTTEEIIPAIDFSIHEAKKNVNDKIVHADHHLSEKMTRTHLIKNLLKYAIENDGFQIYYQPVFSVLDNKFTSAEALLRLIDKEIGFVSPDEFIPIAEETGLIVPIGLIVFEKVCKFIKDTNYMHSGFHSIAVNLSVVQCMQDNIEIDLVNILKKYDIPPDFIKLEITESASAGSITMLKSKMEKLDKAGLYFSLDDFGAGFAGMSYMLELPFKKVKIDKGLLWKSIDNTKNKVILSGIISMIQNLNMMVVAEGVETKEHVEILKKMNCDFFQGYYFSKPMSSNDFIKFVKDNEMIPMIHKN